MVQSIINFILIYLILVIFFTSLYATIRALLTPLPWWVDKVGKAYMEEKDKH